MKEKIEAGKTELNKEYLNRKGTKIMHELTKLIKEDMKPALGVTEPGAIAFAVAKAKTYTGGELVSVKVSMNSGRNLEM